MVSGASSTSGSSCLRALGSDLRSRSVPSRLVVAPPGAKGLFTSTDPESRRVKPENPNGRPVVKVVYVVLEAQYQSALSTAVKNINAKNEKARKAEQGQQQDQQQEQQQHLRGPAAAVGRPAVGHGAVRCRGAQAPRPDGERVARSSPHPTSWLGGARRCASRWWATCWRSSATPRTLRPSGRTWRRPTSSSARSSSSRSWLRRCVPMHVWRDGGGARRHPGMLSTPHAAQPGTPGSRRVWWAPGERRCVRLAVMPG